MRDLPRGPCRYDSTSYVTRNQPITRWQRLLHLHLSTVWEPASPGADTFHQVRKWVFNNMVRLK